MRTALAVKGWFQIGHDAGVAAWSAAARPAAIRAIAQSAEPWRCGETWFAGIDALPNADDGRIGDAPFPEAITRAIPAALKPVKWHPAQISAVRPGYPQPWDHETAAAFGYRLRRDAAHVDGLLPIGPERRRMLREPHAFVLGLPLGDCTNGASPLVVWEGSHRIMHDAFTRALLPHDPRDWPDVDLTDPYHAARREVFANCPRVPLPTRAGEAVLLHRMTLHGVAPWGATAVAPPEGRIIAYFRPELDHMAHWLSLP